MKTGKLVYISIPERLQDRFSGHNGFAFNPAIPLPVELPSDNLTGSPVDSTADCTESGCQNCSQFNTSGLSEEMILAGILLDLAENPDGEHSAYYRNLITAHKPKLAAELQEAAVIKSKNGDYITALEIFRLLEGLLEQNPALLLNRALVLEKAAARENNEAAYREAETAYEKALAAPAQETLLNAGIFYEKRGEYSKAEECLAAYLGAEEEEDKPDAMQARELLNEIRNNSLDDEAFKEALALIRKNDAERSVLKAREFLERQPGAGKGWFVLGWGLRLLSRWKDGAACFEKAVELGCSNAETCNELAICYMETGNWENARKELEKALRLDPENIKIISNMGILAMKQGNKEKAAAFFRTVLELDPEDPIAQLYRQCCI
ncbi:MAG: tetratricopeptide repeat protein [Spirochaetaceae bacterium]|jgi:tetratricopeptide (TPR) repeat protein|nr:tetratricopeptide repeat protein [Spirochaetaceae bacterium]